MAVFPDRIVLKNSTDDEATILTEIETGGGSAITQGEVVLGLASGAATLYTKDAIGDIVTISGSGDGVTSIIAGSGISVDQATGDVTVTATGGGGGGVTSIIAGSGISVDQATGDVTVTATGGGGGGGTGDFGGDPLFSKVTALATFDGETNGASTWTTYGSTSPTWTANGATISNAQTRWGGTTSLSVGAGAPSIPMQLGTDDWTIETWVWLDTGTWSSFGSVIKNGVLADTYETVYIGPNGNASSFRFRIADSGASLMNITGSCVWNDEQWNHVAICRAGDTYSAFINGEKVGYGITSGRTFNSGDLTIGGSDSSTAYLQDFRVTSGVARYSTESYPTPGPADQDGGSSSSSTIVAPFAFGHLNSTTSGTGVEVSWGTYDAGTGNVSVTFDTAQADTSYIVVTDCESADDVGASVGSKSTTGFTLSFYDFATGSPASPSVHPQTFQVFTSSGTQQVAGGGGGGGAVDSVNTQTGVVSLGIQDMDDFELNVTTTYTYMRWATVATSGATGSYDAAGEAGVYFNVGERCVANIVDSDAKDAQAITDAAIVTQGGSTGMTAYVSRDGGTNWVTHTVDVDSTAMGPTLTGILLQNFSPILDGTTDELRLTFEDPNLAPTPLADGDILQWVNSDSKFKPAQLPAAPVDSVNGETGAVVLDADAIDDTATAHKFATAAQLTNADSATQPGDNISTLTNDTGYITLAEIPVSSIDDLSDVDTATVPPTNSQVLSWNGANWVPADQSGGGDGGGGDPLFSHVTALATFDDETNGASTWTTYGSTSPTWTTNGATISNAQTRWGGTTSLSVGAGAPSIPMQLGTDDWTIEAWVRIDINTWNTFGAVLKNGVLADTYDAVYVGPNGGPLSGRFRISNNGVELLTITGGCQWYDDEWNHVAICRAGDTYSAYINGEKIGSGVQSGRTFDSGDLEVGSSGSSTAYVQDFRVTSGVARYSTEYIPTPGPADQDGGGGGGGAVDSVNGQTGVVVLGFTDVGAASAAQGALADSAVQPGDNVSDLANDAGYITLAEVPPGGVTSVNTQTGDVVLDTDDISQGSANLYSQWDDVTGGIGYASGDVLIGGTLPSAPNVTIESTGEITALADANINSVNVGLGGGDLDGNTVLGGFALISNTTGTTNTAVGRSALYDNTEGTNNTALGNAALRKNTTGVSNTAVGASTLFSNATGSHNTAVGRQALTALTSGDDNTSIGRGTLDSHITGNYNTALGRSALGNSTAGDYNLAVGRYALLNLTSGNNNTFIGSYTGEATLSDTVSISAGTTEKLRIDSTGSLLFGGTLPSAPNVTIEDTGAITATSATFIAPTDDGTVNIVSEDNATDAGNKIAFFGAGRSDAGNEMAYIKPLLVDNSGGTGIQSGHLTFGTLGIERLRITNDGTIVMGGDATINGMTVGLGGGSGASNVAFGSAALASNTTGLYNVAIGRQALQVSNANSNTAIGHNTLLVNTTGVANLAIGRQSLTANTEGGNNTGVGFRTLFVNTTGVRNTAVGDSSLFNNLTGSDNTAVGRYAGRYIEGSNNTIIGNYEGTAADSTLSDTVIIAAGAAEKLRIDSTGSLLFGGTLPGTPNITLNADGTGSFAGKLTSVSTVAGDVGTILATKDYVDSNSGGGSVGIDPVISGMIF